MRPWESGFGPMEARPASSEHGERGGHDTIPSPRPRVANACDVCKRRKVKCNGEKPCAYCLSRKLPSLCVYSPPKQRRPRASRLSGIGLQGAAQDESSTSSSRTGRGERGSPGVVEDGDLHSTASSSQRALSSAPVASSRARALSRSSRQESPPVVTKESQTPSRSSLPGVGTGGSAGGGGGGGSRPGGSESRSQSRQDHQRNQDEDQLQQEQEERREQQEASREPGQGSNPGPGAEAHEETEVPREGRLLVDPQGKLIFIGDCAPLSFFRTVQRLITSRIDPDAFAPENSGYSALENNASYPRAAGVFPGGGGGGEGGNGFGGLYGGGRGGGLGFGHGPPPVQTSIIEAAVTAYFQSTTGLVDIFDDQAQQPRHLIEEITSWAAQLRGGGGGGGGGGGVPLGGDATSAVFYLVLAIGLLFQKKNNPIANTKSSSSPSEVGSSFSESERIAQAYFDHARELAFAHLTGNLGLASVQSFMLITLYMLGACQINGAFIFFGIAARSAFSIGIHRTEVNARFSPEIHRQRDRLWKSLRVLDLFLSTSMGRPPATSDVDCTVLYHAVDGEGREQTDPEADSDYLLNGSAQIFLIIEGIVLEVYSRRKISPQLTEGISRELREWSARWLQRLKRVIEDRRPSPRQTPLLTPAGSMAMVNGACQVLASYYYAVILVSRPFLMVELRRRLTEGYPAEAFTARDGLVTSGKSKLADACIDAASLMVDPIQDLIQRGLMTRRAPLIVSWLFASSLVLGLGLLGGFGRIIEKYCRASIAALEYFAEADAHAVQYSLIAKSLLNTALAYLEKREMQDRLRRTESSSQLFGLIPRGNSGDGTANDNTNNNTNNDHGGPNPSTSHHQQHQHDQQSHYQRSIQHTNPSVGGQFAGGPHGIFRGDGGTHPQQLQQQPKPSSHHTSHHNHHQNYHNYHHHHHHGPTSSSFSPSRFNTNLTHSHFDFIGHGHGHGHDGSTATTFLGMTESLPRTPEFSIMGGSLDSDADQTFGAMNLFPLLETDGHIDLANYF